MKRTVIRILRERQVVIVNIEHQGADPVQKTYVMRRNDRFKSLIRRIVDENL